MKKHKVYIFIKSIHIHFQVHYLFVLTSAFSALQDKQLQQQQQHRQHQSDHKKRIAKVKDES